MPIFKVVPWPNKHFFEMGTPDHERQTTLELDSRRMAHKEFFESADQPSLVYCFHYICEHGDPGQKYLCLYAGEFDRKTRLERTHYGRPAVRHFDLRDETLSFRRLPGFKGRDPEAEAAQEVWSKFSPAVHEKFLSQAAPCDRNEDGTPNFSMIGVMGKEDLKDELSSMQADYYGEHITNSKFGVDNRLSFASEDEAIETFFEDPRGWNIHKWDAPAKRWLTAVLKKSADKKSRVVEWVCEE